MDEYHKKLLENKLNEKELTHLYNQAQNVTLPSTITKEHVPILNNLIDIQNILADNEILEELEIDKDQLSMPQCRQLSRLEKLKEFVVTGEPITLNYSNAKGLIIMKNKYIASLASNKWRVLGTNKWNRYKTPQQLVEKIYKEKNNEL